MGHWHKLVRVISLVLAAAESKAVDSLRDARLAVALVEPAFLAAAAFSLALYRRRVNAYVSTFKADVAK